MDKETFNNTINNPTKHVKNLSKEQLDKLKTTFPYCEIIHVLSVLKAKQEKDISFTETLTISSLYASNRRNLFNLIQPHMSSNIKNIQQTTSHPFEEWLRPNSRTKNQEMLLKKSVTDNDYLTTETLAEIYVEQAHYQRAIQAYEILCLKYPKKSGLFANRIKEIKNKID